MKPFYFVMLLAGLAAVLHGCMMTFDSVRTEARIITLRAEWNGYKKTGVWPKPYSTYKSSPSVEDALGWTLTAAEDMTARYYRMRNFALLVTGGFLVIAVVGLAGTRKRRRALAVAQDPSITGPKV